MFERYRELEPVHKFGVNKHSGNKLA